jgi:hypothetical protein
MNEMSENIWIKNATGFIKWQRSKTCLPIIYFYFLISDDDDHRRQQRNYFHQKMNKNEE